MIAEPLGLAGLHRLHNSGFGTPTVMRTPPVGQRFCVPTAAVLAAWPPLDDRDRQAWKDGTTEAGSVTPALVARTTGRVLEALGSPAEARDPVARLRQLRDLVVRQGWTQGILLLTDAEPPEPRYDEYRKREPGVDAREAALAITTFACVHRPLVLWGAEPSLDLLLRTATLGVQWCAPKERGRGHAGALWRFLLEAWSQA